MIRVEMSEITHAFILKWLTKMSEQQAAKDANTFTEQMYKRVVNEALSEFRKGMKA